ncbi:phosphoenolpyruvate--protein phosphotransferase [Treponema sp.]|uniref:phosphoenolpyruvate--protein phosphotransferase n=1 Tax=Treponema sp. TaxID=166 RepID=UPI003F07E46D
MNVILGISAAEGIGIGKAFVLPDEQERKIPKRKISASEVESGWRRLTEACARVQKEFSDSLSSGETTKAQREVIETYQLMLSDPVFMTELQDFFSKKLLNIEYCLNFKIREYADMLRNSHNEYLAERAKDIEDVFNRVLDILLDYHPFDIWLVPDGAVIVGRSMKTSDTVILGKRKIAGLALTEGSSACHVAILAKSYGIPVVVGIGDASSLTQNGETVVVDGNIGELIIQPDSATLTSANAKILSDQKYRSNLLKFKELPAATEDGVIFKLFANIGTPEEAQIALDNGADGIGLFRTEFLFMNSSKKFSSSSSYANSMSEDAQFEAYKKVLQLMGNRPVTIRTLDAGGDKVVDGTDLPAVSEKNPLMGLRAIRMSLYCPSVFRTQLRALYRASVYGNLRIMLPLITDVSQVETALGIAKGIRISLKEDNIPFNPDVPIGIMVETAAAAICADCLAPYSKFFSLGTNDLTQYVLGVDRENQAVNPLYNEFSLAVLRMIKNTIQNAEKFNIPLSVCGEMAGNRESAVILAGMGVRNLSMVPKQIPVIKEMLSHFSIKELENLSKRSVF